MGIDDTYYVSYYIPKHLRRCSLKRVLAAVFVFFVIVITVVEGIIIVTTDPPHAYMVKNLEEQLECAKKAGFTVKPPRLRMLKPPYEPDSPHGFAHMSIINMITLVHFASYETLGHELGHIIDYQTGRKGHPFFDDKKDWSDQALADAIKEAVFNACRTVE